MAFPAGVRPALRGSAAWQDVQAGVSGLPPANFLWCRVSPRAAENPANAGDTVLAAAAYWASTSSRGPARLAVAVASAQRVTIAVIFRFMFLSCCWVRRPHYARGELNRN